MTAFSSLAVDLILVSHGICMVPAALVSSVQEAPRRSIVPVHEHPRQSKAPVHGPFSSVNSSRGKERLTSLEQRS